MKKLLLKVKLFFAAIFGNLDKFITNNVDEGINIVEAIKSVVNSGIVQVVVNITPTNIDNKALEQAKKYLDIALQKLEIGKECAGLQTPAERLKCAVEKLAAASPHVRNALYLKIASLYAKTKAQHEGKEIKAGISDVDTLVQLRYKNINI